jgi:hypothetical protein
MSRQVCLTLENARLMFGQECVASRSLARICAIKQLPGSGLKFYVRQMLMVSGRSSRASLVVLESGCFYSYGFVHYFACRNCSFRNTQPTKCTVLFLRQFHYNITPKIPTCFDPQWIIIREHNQNNSA